MQAILLLLWHIASHDYADNDECGLSRGSDFREPD